METKVNGCVDEDLPQNAGSRRKRRSDCLTTNDTSKGFANNWKIPAASLKVALIF